MGLLVLAFKSKRGSARMGVLRSSAVSWYTSEKYTRTKRSESKPFKRKKENKKWKLSWLSLRLSPYTYEY